MRVRLVGMLIDMRVRRARRHEGVPVRGGRGLGVRPDAHELEVVHAGAFEAIYAGAGSWLADVRDEARRQEDLGGGFLLYWAVG